DHEWVYVRDFLRKAEVLPRLGLGSRPVPRNVRVLSQQEELPAFEAEYARLAACPLLATWESLYSDDEQEQFDADDFAALVASPYLTNLRKVWVSRTAIGNAGVAALAGAPSLAGLRSLILGHIRADLDEAGDEGAQALAASSALTRP